MESSFGIPTWDEVFMTDKMWECLMSQFPFANFQENHWVSRFGVAVDFLGPKRETFKEFVAISKSRSCWD